MKAWRLHEAGKLTLDELPVQTVGAGCIKLKTLACSVGLSDVLAFEGQVFREALPMIIGRECVGLVTETGEGVTSLTRGDRVAVDPFVSCKACPPCKSGRADHCEKLYCLGVDDNGFMSDFSVVSADSAYRLPDRIKDQDAVFLPHIALAISTVNKLKLDKGQNVVIVGAGALGLILAQVVLYYQAVPILVDVDADRLRLAESLGVYYTVNSVDADPQKRIFAITGGHMSEAVAYMSPSHMSFARSLDFAARGGKVAVTGWSDTVSDQQSGFASVIKKQLTVMGVNNGARLFPASINLLANNTINVAPLISREIPFAEVDAGVRDIAKNKDRYIKVLVKP